MKASPYLIFNGNCVEAVELYEKAFKTKANLYYYKDAPEGEAPAELGGLVMHGVLPVGKSTIYLCDTTPDKKTAFGDGAFACVELDSVEEAKAVYEVLKEGGKVFCETQETFWNKCYAELEDKFGMKWNMMVECTCTEECAGGCNSSCACAGCICKDKKA
jgi:PhnB protein